VLIRSELTHRGIMPVTEDQITPPLVGIMPVMQVIEAQRASILLPDDHLYNNHERHWRKDMEYLGRHGGDKNQTITSV